MKDLVAGARLVEVRVDEDGAGQRLDQFLANADALGVSRSQVKRLVDAGHVTVNGELARVSARIEAGDDVRVLVPPPLETEAEAEDIPLTVVFEDQHLIVVDKPPGMVVHPAPGHPRGTLVNALLFHCGDLSGIGGERRPGIVHRIDKGTSGVMVATKDDDTHQALAALFAAHEIDREYLAVLAPPPPQASGTFDTLHGRHPRARKKFSSRVDRGKRAVTHWVLQERFELAALVRCRLETGRTHQIRVHFADAGTPLLGDPLYARKRAGPLGEIGTQLGRQALHAAVLGFRHPTTGEILRFERSPPPDFTAALAALAALDG